ncbi:hypothetical protein CgunFtcFv8_010411 [Champsocephalus gunnari]|uniref:Uncharacterized protein n=1 Tax=Champsocephalus gunnari TaxID=52237 RepID=A0AAN8DVX5_CHAGU|nr:hypothetical protein CgunFtcFv8_010411 [Champsocephalus gunnari]
MAFGAEDLCGCWFHAIRVSEVPIVQGVQLRILKSNGCLCPYPGLDMDPQNMLLQRSKCWRELVTLCPVFAEEMPS